MKNILAKIALLIGVTLWLPADMLAQINPQPAIDSATQNPASLRIATLICTDWSTLPTCLHSDFAVTSTACPTANGCHYITQSCTGSTWFTVFGTPAIDSGSLVMVANRTEGESPATCFKFERGKTYSINFDMRTSGQSGASLSLRATKEWNSNTSSFVSTGVEAQTPIHCQEPPTAYGAVQTAFEVIGAIPNPSNPTYSFTYTPSKNYAQLWLFIETNNSINSNFFIDNFNISEMPPPVITLIPPSCAAVSDAEASVPYTAAYTYAWAEQGSTGIMSDREVVTALSAGSIYIVTVTSPQGCTATQSVTVPASTTACYTCNVMNAPKIINDWDFESAANCNGQVSDGFRWLSPNPTICNYIKRSCTATPAAVGEWYTVHGTPEWVTGVGDDHCINMEAYGNSVYIRGQYHIGESFAHCYKFEKGVAYRICCRVKRKSPWNGAAGQTDIEASLQCFATNNVYERTPKHCMELFKLADIPSKQLIFTENITNTSYPIATGSTQTDWKYLSTTYTPDQDYAQLWCNLSNGIGLHSASGFASIYIDEIKIFPISNGQCCDEQNCLSSLRPLPGKKYVVSAWVREDCLPENEPISFVKPQLTIDFPTSQQAVHTFTFVATGPLIEGWQRVFGELTVPEDAADIQIFLKNRGGSNSTPATAAVFFDDIRLQPYDSKMKAFVYDPTTLRLVAEMDENNYGTFYEYDKEGKLERVKRETERGMRTIKEARSSSVK